MMLPKRACVLFCGFALLVCTSTGRTQESRTQTSASGAITIDASAPPPPVQPVRAALGTSRRPDGETLTVNSQYLVLNGQPWLPVMGEFHFSRMPQEDWETEILKMKAGGVQIIATYVIWIHHEEAKGEDDWSGQRDLRAFVELCAKHGMYVYPRIGPWAHGETRNGGIPDWAMQASPTRKNDPVYLAEVTHFFGQIGQQLKGEMWKDGGPVIGIQLENEYRGDGSAGTGEDHIRTLKRIAIEAGMDTPLYTVTGWDGAAIPRDAVLPVYGGYPDAPWEGSTSKMPPNEVYVFRRDNRVGGNMGMIGGKGQNAASAYAGTPFLTAEVGGGMQDTYFRRPVVSADDIASIPTVMIGSGANQLGFYMFHGGRNPEGKLSTLEESQATGDATDVPVKSYDFQAPLGAYGQERESFRRLKLMNYFLADFGSRLAPMPVYFPAQTPASPSDLSVPRVTARVTGGSGFIFVNNYVRGVTMPARRGFTVRLKTAEGVIQVPERPVDLPSGAYGVWPVNQELGGVMLRYSTAQLFHTFSSGGDRWYCFFAMPGIVPEFALKQAPSASVGWERRSAGGITYLRAASTRVPLQAEFRQGANTTHLLLLSREQAETMWKVPGQEAPLLTSAQFYADQGSATMTSDGDPHLSFSVMAETGMPEGSAALVKSRGAGIFATYAARFPTVKLPAVIKQVSAGEARGPMKFGKPFSWRKTPLPMAPGDAEFEKAARWEIHLPEGWKNSVSDAKLVVRYEGDAARLRTGQRLLDDDFGNGLPWQMSVHDLEQQGAAKTLDLSILPFAPGSAIYLERAKGEEIKKLQSVPQPEIEFVPQYQLKVQLKK